MLTTVIKFIAPAHSYRGKKTRMILKRFRNRRALDYSKACYDAHRQNYYAHAVMKDIVTQTAKVSIVVPCFNTPQKYFEPLLASVFAQGYQNWELILIDASNTPESTEYLLEKSSADSRIKYLKVKNEGIAINTNKGIEVATGSYVAFLDHDDSLDPNALAENMAMFIENPKLGLVYSDEDKISDDGERYFEPHFKPGFSLDMLRNVNYITHFVMVRKTIVDQVGCIREGYDGAQDYDFLLRVVDLGTQIGHVAKILYHWRQADGSTASNFANKQHITQAGCRALEEHYGRRGIVNVQKVRAIKDRPGFYRAYYNKPKESLKILINLENTNLMPIEKDYIIGCYRENKDVITNNIEVIERKIQKTDLNTLVVNGAFIPSDENTDILSLFALAQEEHVGAVAPKIIRHGRIYDMGIVKVAGLSKNLFHNLSPDRFRGFGSLEWVRNVDSLTGNVQTVNGPKNTKERCIIWSHSEFIAFESENHKRQERSSGELYNSNILEVTEIYEASADYISDLVTVKK